jgi:hypothetical protein
MKKTLLGALPFLFMLLSLNPKAQVSYSFSKTTSNTYTELTADSVLPALMFDPNSGLITLQDLQGETFNFFDVAFPFGPFKAISIGEAAFLRIDNDSSIIIIDAAFTYMNEIDATSKRSYKITGSSGNKILVVQYKNMELQYGPTGNFINTQIWYYQQSGIIEIHYGPRSLNNASGYNTIQGPNIGIFYSPNNFSSCYEKIWCEGSPTNLVLDSAANFNFDAMSGVPDNGTMYRFTPRTQTLNAVSIKEVKNESILKLLPNPANNKLTISGNKINSSIFIYGTNGQLLKETVNVSEVIELDVSDLPEGIYFARTLTGNGQTTTSKFVIDR